MTMISKTAFSFFLSVVPGKTATFPPPSSPHPLEIYLFYSLNFFLNFFPLSLFSPSFPNYRKAGSERVSDWMRYGTEKNMEKWNTGKIVVADPT